MGKGDVELSKKSFEHFFLLSHDETHEDIKVHMIGHCDPND